MIKTKKQLETNHINELLKNIRYAYKIAGLYICSDKKFIHHTWLRQLGVDVLVETTCLKSRG